MTSSPARLRLVRSPPAVAGEEPAGAEPDGVGGTAAPASAGPDVDPRDLDAVFRRFGPYVARIGARLLGRADEVDDLVQDVFLDAMRGLASLRDAGAVRAWLATVTVRHARRRLARRSLLSFFGLDRGVDPESLMDPATEAEARAEVIAVYRALESVDADARIAWTLHVVEGHALEEIAEIAGYSRATAHRRIQLAQAAVEAALRGS